MKTEGNIPSTLLPFSGRWLIALAAAIVLTRWSAGAFLGVIGRPQWWEYDVIAANISLGHGPIYDRLGFVYSAYAPPLWSYLLALLNLAVGGSRLAIQIVQASFVFAAALAFGRVAHEISNDERAGRGASLLIALQPSLLYYSVAKSDPLPLNVLLLGLMTLAGTALVREPSRRCAWTFGAFAGLGVLSRGTPVIALPLFLSALAIRRSGVALKPIATSLLAFAVCLAPWLARNFFVLGTPMITSTTGENFWRGNHQGAGGGVTDQNGNDITQLVPDNQALPDAVRAVLTQGTEAERHAVFMQEATRFIQTSPAEATTLFVRKLRIFWWRIDSDASDYPPIWSAVYEALYRIELALALVGGFATLGPVRAGRLKPDRWAAGLAALFMIGISLLQSAFYVQGRHRFLIEPLLLVFTACGIASLLPRLGAKTHSSNRRAFP